MAESQTAAEITTGVVTDKSRIKTMEHDAEAFADDGEHATVWYLTRVDETTIESVAFRCEAGLRERVKTGVEVFDVEPETSLREFGREHANADPELAVELAREHFSDE